VSNISGLSSDWSVGTDNKPNSFGTGNISHEVKEKAYIWELLFIHFPNSLSGELFYTKITFNTTLGRTIQTGIIDAIQIVGYEIFCMLA
jgi:hypothetical protein